MSIKLSFSCLLDASYTEVEAYLSKKESLKRMIPPWAPSSWKINSKRVDSIGEYHYQGFKTLFFSCFIKRSLVSLQSQQTEIIDEVVCHARMGFVFFKKTMKKKLCGLIEHQHANMIEDLKQLRLSQVSSNDVIVIAGASGFIGRFLKTILGLFGYKVKTLVRHRPNFDEEIFWDPQCELIDKRALDGVYGVINLSGESIFSLRWTKKKKERILRSRIQATRFLAETMNSLTYPPKVFLSASAVGFYGDRSSEQLTENASKGNGFLSDVASLWEEASLKYTKGRVCSLRFGVVIGTQGGVLKKLKPLFSLGLGAILGSGKEVMSWVSIDDVAYQILFLLKHQVKGPVNLCSCNPITQQEFARSLGQCCKKRVWLKIPRWLVKLLFGQMSSLFLFSTSAQPKKLLELGAVFSYPNFKNTLHHQIQP